MIWKPLIGYEKSYEISNTGLIKSLERLLKNHRNSNTFRICSERFLKGCVNNSGYLYVDLYSGKRIRKRFYVHKLVGIHFVENPDNKPEINHKDGNKANNNDWNLEWNTRKENQKHAFDKGYLKPEIARAAKKLNYVVYSS